MRFYVRIRNKDIGKILSWVNDNIINTIPLGSDPKKNNLKISSGKRNTHIRFDVFELDGSYENYKILDEYMTDILCDFSSKFKREIDNTECWYEYRRKK